MKREERKKIRCNGRDIEEKRRIEKKIAEIRHKKEKERK